MRITCVIFNLALGGAERNLLLLAGWLAEKGYEVTLLTLDDQTPDFYPIPPGVGRHRAGAEAAASFRWFNLAGQYRRRKAIRKELHATRPDLVVSFLNTTNLSVLSALAGEGIPVVVSERSDPRFEKLRWRWRLLRRILYPRAARVVMLASDALSWANSRWPGWRACAIPNPVLPSPCHLEKGRPAWFGPRNLIGMGRLHPVKGFDRLIRVFSRLAGDFPDWHLVLLGEGEERPILEGQVRQADLTQRIHLVGAVDPPQPLLEQADIFVFTSRQEGFGMALAEAMACGLPAVSFDCPSGPRQILRDGVDGILVANGDEGGLEGALRQLMGDSERRQWMGRNASKVVERFELEQIMSEWQTVIDEALGASR